MKKISAAAAELGRKGGSSRSEAKQSAARANGGKGGRPVKGSLKNQCTQCGKIHFLKPSEGTFGRWYGACSECGSEFLAQGKAQEKPANVKVTLIKAGTRA